MYRGEPWDRSGGLGTNRAGDHLLPTSMDLRLQQGSRPGDALMGPYPSPALNLSMSPSSFWRRSASLLWPSNSLKQKQKQIFLKLQAQLASSYSTSTWRPVSPSHQWDNHLSLQITRPFSKPPILPAPCAVCMPSLMLAHQDSAQGTPPEGFSGSEDPLCLTETNAIVPPPPWHLTELKYISAFLFPSL